MSLTHFAAGADAPPAHSFASPRFPRRGPVAALAAALLLAGCGSLTGEGPSASGGPAAASAPTSFPRERLIGRWGIASYHTEKDRKRTEAQAKGGCGQPYVIAKGPSDGVMMHAADDPKLYELRLKAGPGGKTYLGFEAPAGDPQDREIVSASEQMLVMRFVDPDANRRYGTFIYARCGA